MVMEMSVRFKAALEDWGGVTADNVPLDAMLARAKVSPVPSPAEWSKEAPSVVPAKYLNGRDAKYYQEYIKAVVK
jgi:hypothetical protein